MTPSPLKPLVPLISPPSHVPRPRQLSMVFEFPVLQDLTSSERAGVVAQLANLLLQATGRAAEDDDGEL
jgi:hypothetical protein